MMILTGLFITFLVVVVVIAIGVTVSSTHKDMLKNKLDYLDSIVGRGFKDVKDFE